jgi:hypothetical protein
MKAAVRPFVRTRYKAVLDGVVMDVIYVVPEIVVIAYHMIPKPPLPHTALATFAARFVSGQLWPARSQK